MMTKTVIVGAGPVGLWTAIQIKAQNPDMEIEILEKRQDYQRAHTIKLSINTLNSLKVSKNSQYSKDIDAMRLAIVNPNTKINFDLFIGRYTNIKTNELELALKQCAKDMGINITIKTVKSLKEISTDVKYIIGADGAHSVVRGLIGDSKVTSENTIRDTLQYVVEMKYEATSNDTMPVILKRFQEKYQSRKICNFYVEESIGRMGAANNYPVSVRFFVDKDTYEALGEATFIAPQTFKQHNTLPSKLQHDVNIWLNTRQKKGEQLITENFKITKIPLERYHSKIFAKQVNNQNIFLAGDAAGAVPYFRALNAGFERAAKLGQCIALDINPNNTSKLVDEYQKWMLKSCKRENFKAKIKYFIIRFITWLIYISGQVFWQTNKYSAETIKDLTNNFSTLIANQDKQHKQHNRLLNLS